MRRLLALFVAVVFTALAVHAQEVTSSESWSGAISLGSGKLNIGFVINTMSDGTQRCTMDVPDQGVKDFPVALVASDEHLLSISIAQLNAMYEGRRITPELIEGTFTQNGIALPLNLKRGAIQIRRPQTPEPPFVYVTEDVTFSNEAEDAVLSGTLTYPVNYDKHNRGSVPVVVMVTGSGAQDRDETLFGHKPFLVIADYLARHGIASLRYDDRGVAKSTGSVEGTTTMNNLADAEAGVEYLRALDRFGKVGVLGHSEGGTIAFMMGANRSVDFLVSLAGAAASGMEVIIGQNRVIMQQQGVPQMVVDDYVSALRIIYGDRVAGVEVADAKQYVADVCSHHSLSLPDAFMENLAMCVTTGGEWFTWFLSYDPKAAISRIKCPVMALNGSMDMQVLSDDNLPIIRENLPRNRRSVVREYDNLNHLFQHCTLETSLSYGAIEETISEEVLGDIVSWINSIK